MFQYKLNAAVSLGSANLWRVKYFTQVLCLKIQMYWWGCLFNFQKVYFGVFSCQHDQLHLCKSNFDFLNPLAKII